ncbi:MAG: sulfatase-like hydrolase/transferase, partial [Acidimicrobiales bacterium]|nr:sulfatase-like hydrolase/transferase [Acidimicrobiales bacterium]
DDTIVIFTSDNGALARPGEGSNLPLRGRKGQTRDGGMRVPGIVRWPGQVPAGSTSDALTTALDLLPTLATWCDADPTTRGPIDGHDIGAVLTDGASSPRSTFAYFNQSHLEAIRDNRYKLRLVANDGQTRAPVTELYDLHTDIDERTDIARNHPEIVARLTSAADALRTELGDAMTGEIGRACRPVGLVEDGRPLSRVDDGHPVIIAEYDLADRG